MTHTKDDASEPRLLSGAMGFFSRPAPPKSVNATQLNLQFAVVDIETTGLSEVANRIIEIAIVILSAQGEILHEWHTLVNPGDGNAGPTAIHGIQGSWLAAAPTFKQVSGDIAELFLGRVPVAHNGKFDFGFIEAEFKRIGVTVRSDLTYFDTMTTADLLGLPRKLSNLARELGVTYFAHGALEDARTTARILARLLTAVSASTFTNDFIVSPGIFPATAPSRRCIHRESAEELTRPSSFLAEASDYLPSLSTGSWADPEPAAAYLNLLEICMDDGYLSPEEKAQLLQTAQQWGLSIEQVRSIHEEFLDSLLTTALGDRAMSKSERLQVTNAAAWLGVPEEQVDVLVRRARARARAELNEKREEVRGRVISFTGKGMFSHSIREGLCAKYGITFKSSVTRDTELLVVGTADVENSNVMKARALNLRVVDEPFFWSYLGERG